MAAYVEGSVRLRWIDWTRRAAGAEEPDPGRSKLSCLCTDRAGQYSRTQRRFHRTTIKSASTSIGERIALLAIVEKIASGLLLKRP